MGEEVSPNHSEEKVKTRNEQDLPEELKDGRTRDLRTRWTRQALATILNGTAISPLERKEIAKEDVLSRRKMLKGEKTTVKENLAIFLLLEGRHLPPLERNSPALSDT